ncbi:hypothetical protein TWF192_009177 [Orbilia oligospora]|uniref:Cytochrome c oxidase subunit 8, mitochondrial n=1 Tax=Orbilia oligospora TaxID=2813651 RepID=A0A6G1M3B6_ORBOL|nr:hypothetical protein TWF191_009808 [Orbilia oligospora]KAF3241439.1 hypothetical protein TWF192_009177 [Orbilia oligospora]
MSWRLAFGYSRNRKSDTMRPQIASRVAGLRTVTRQNFSTSAPRMSSPYHYPSGPRSNLPFDPLNKFFGVKFVTFCAVGFALPFGIAVWQTKKKSFL